MQSMSANSAIGSRRSTGLSQKNVETQKRYIPVSKTLTILAALIVILAPAQLAIADYLGTINGLISTKNGP